MNLRRVSLFLTQHSRARAKAQKDAEKMVQLCHTKISMLAVFGENRPVTGLRQARATSITLLSPPTQLE